LSPDLVGIVGGVVPVYLRNVRTKNRVVLLRHAFTRLVIQLDQSLSDEWITTGTARLGALASWVPVKVSERTESVVDARRPKLGFNSTEVLNHVLAVKKVTDLVNDKDLLTIDMVADFLGVSVEDDSEVVPVTRSADLNGDEESETGSCEEESLIGTLST
jgi:hypothetical protein